MADFYYQKFSKNLGMGLIDFSAGSFKVALVRETGGTPYVPSQSADEFLAIIPGGAITATTSVLTGITWAAGAGASYVFAAADSVLVSVTGVVSSLVLYKDTGVSATSILIARFDSFTGLPYTGAGSAVTIQYPSGASKIVKLG